MAWTSFYKVITTTIRDPIRIRYNATNSSTPIIVNNHLDTYVNPNGTIFVTVGTAGAKPYAFAGQAPYIAKQFEGYGFLDVKLAENGTKMLGTFYDNLGGKDKDSFTIVKNITKKSNLLQ